MLALPKTGHVMGHIDGHLYAGSFPGSSKPSGDFWLTADCTIVLGTLWKTKYAIVVLYVLGGENSQYEYTDTGANNGGMK